MITDDYVSFETAKLLKEKGFDGRENCCHAGYFNGNLIDYTLFGFCDGEITLAPTMQMDLKWLREVHNIFIDIITYTASQHIQFRWVGYDKGRLFCEEEKTAVYYDKYEQAVEAALLYVLKNLI